MGLRAIVDSKSSQNQTKTVKSNQNRRDKIHM